MSTVNESGDDIEEIERQLSEIESNSAANNISNQMARAQNSEMSRQQIQGRQVTEQDASDSQRNKLEGLDGQR